jgi:hypothetical protein
MYKIKGMKFSSTEMEKMKIEASPERIPRGG